MTFGKIKSLIEKNLFESYRNEKEFKKILREFKYNILNDKNISKIYSVYDQLSSPQNLSESDAKEFLNEGLDLLRILLPKIKLPKALDESIENKYSDIDALVYNSKTQISERIQSKKNILEVLMSNKEIVRESINVPISTMVNVANQTLKNYIETLDEQSKKEFFKIISEDHKTLEIKFETLKETAISKLQNVSNFETDEIKSKINETINKIKTEKFDQLNFLKMKTLVESL